MAPEKRSAKNQRIKVLVAIKNGITSPQVSLVYLRALSVPYPTIDATLAAIAKLRAFLTLRKGTVHDELVVTGRVGAERVCDFIQRFASWCNLTGLFHSVRSSSSQI